MVHPYALPTDQRTGNPQRRTILDVCAAHLVGRDLLRTENLVLLPYRQPTVCGDLPDHSRAVVKAFTSMTDGIINTVEKHYPEDSGLLRVRSFLPHL
jgi:hypothetical protein